MTHGYMLSGSGSNVYVQNLCRALVRQGHDVHLLCQDPDALAYDFVSRHATAGDGGIRQHGEQETPYPGRCIVYNPRIGDLLPVYVYDDYPGWRVKTFLDLTDRELEDYLGRNAAAVRTVLDLSQAEAVVTNHSVPGPLIARRALKGRDVLYTSIVHGSCLQYVSRRSERYMSLTRQGLEGAENILALSAHSAGTIAEDFPDLAKKTRALPGGVDTELFQPDALDTSSLRSLEGGPGRGPKQDAALRRLLERVPATAEELAQGLRDIAASYNARSRDRDAGERLDASLRSGSPLVICVGKLIHAKGVHSLISAFARVRHRTGARLLVVGFGTLREALQALTLALSAGDARTVRLLAGAGTLFEGAPERPLEHFEVSEELLRNGASLAGSIEFIGPLYHEELSKLLPAADAGVVPSIFPETFGLVAAELAASGVVPFVAGHSGLSEAGGIIGEGLPFDLRISVEGLEENLARALADYLHLPEEHRRRCRRLVRQNSADRLSWDTLAGRLVSLASSGG